MCWNKQKKKKLQAAVAFSLKQTYTVHNSCPIICSREDLDLLELNVIAGTFSTKPFWHLQTELQAIASSSSPGTLHVHKSLHYVYTLLILNFEYLPIKEGICCR